MATYAASGGQIYEIRPCPGCGQFNLRPCRACGPPLGMDGVNVLCSQTPCWLSLSRGREPNPNCRECNGTGIRGERGPWRRLGWYPSAPDWRPYVSY